VQVIPAIDLREGACVQLVGGLYTTERIRIADPIAVAERWTRLGFSRIHVVDLDAATGRGSNRAIVREILNATDAKVQCGGGVRDLDTIDELLSAGASEVVLGTRAVEDRAWLEEAVARYPDRIIVAADTSSGRVVTQGWSKTDSRDVIAFIEGLCESGNAKRLPLAAVLVTAVDREGRMQGPDLALIREITARVSIPIQASGGVRDVDDIRALADAGASAAIIGMALYTGGLDPQTIIEEMSAWA
jgi:phosphoribosylformimino-5-aminoimidazole carboxamide ribotide isomerase